jgi:outer membrane protein assembly factor BamB
LRSPRILKIGMMLNATGIGTTTLDSRPQFAGLTRIVLAGLLTVGVLPYTWAYNFISYQLAGALNPFFAVCLVLAVLGIMALTWHVGQIAGWRRNLRLVVLAVAVAWIAVNVAMFAKRLGTLIPASVVIAAYIPGSLLVPWVAWMFFGPWRWPVRLAVTSFLLILLIGFVALFRVDGLTGSSNVDISWRLARSPGSHAMVGVAPAHADAADRVLVEDPLRDYPQFLGPDRTAVLPNVLLDANWKDSPPRELWRRPVGLGWSSFAVVGNFAFTQEQRGDQECITCYELLTGEEVWVHAEPANFTSSLGGPGPRATPTVTRNKVLAVGATGVLSCLEAPSGRRIWSVDILQDNDAENIAHGVCASPLVLGDRVLVCPTGSDGPPLAAYDLNTGQRAWAAGEHQASYSSPIIAELAGVPQILLYDGSGVSGYDCDTGAVLWHFAWTNMERTNVAQPIVHAGGPDQVFISTGYGKGCVLIGVDRSADGSWSVREVWKKGNLNLKSKFCTPVLYGDHVLGLDDGILACIELSDGKRTWKAGRYGHGQILRAGKLLIVQAEEGDVVLGEVDPRQWRELGRIKALSGKTWNNPALAGPYLLVRNDREAACFELACLPASAGTPAAAASQDSQQTEAARGSGATDDEL